MVILLYKDMILPPALVYLAVTVESKTEKEDQLMPAMTPNKQHLFISNLCMIALFIFCVIVVNWSVISFDFLCPEQIVVYIANLNIKSFGNILDIYLYPKMLQHNIPFFRPTGHFVMYQLFAPWPGWQNSKGLIVINLVILAITGYVMLKIYELLFPHHNLSFYVMAQYSAFDSQFNAEKP